jgi:hypothetical protein
VLLGGYLPDDIARLIACSGSCRPLSSDAPVQAADEEVTDSYSIEGCRRFTARRVDCVVEEIVDDSYDGESDYCRVHAITLDRSGHIYRRGYGLIEDFCPAKRRIAGMFKPHPSRWNEPARRVDPVAPPCGCSMAFP